MTNTDRCGHRKERILGCMAKGTEVAAKKTCKWNDRSYTTEEEHGN